MLGNSDRKARLVHGGVSMSSCSTLTVEAVFKPSSKCILVVEDELFIRLALSDGLRDVGYQVIEAFNGDEAIEALSSVRPDLVISDVRMPGSLDGIALLAIVRREFPDLPVIMVSGHLRPFAALADGTTQFLPKPYAMDEMLQAVEVEIGKPA